MASDSSTPPSDITGESQPLSGPQAASLSTNSVLPISQGYTLLESHANEGYTRQTLTSSSTVEKNPAYNDEEISAPSTSTAFLDDSVDLIGPRPQPRRGRRNTRLRFRTTYSSSGDVKVRGISDAIEDLEDAYEQSLPLYDALMLRLREASRKRPRLFMGMATWLGLAGLVYINSQYVDPIIPFNTDAGSTTFSMVLPSSRTIQGVMQQNYDSKLEDIATALEANALLPEEPASGLIRHEVSDGESLWHLTQMYQLDAAAIAMSNGIDGQTELDPGRVLYIPRTEGIVYSVRQGDTLASIANEYEITPEDIIRATPLSNSSFLSIGQRLVIPAPVTDILDLRQERAEALAAIEAEREAEAEAARLEAEERAAEIASGQSQDYTVRSGDTLGTIAARYGTTVNSLIAANPGVSIAFLRVGQDLVIPGNGTTTAAASNSSSPSTTSNSSGTPQSYRVQSGDTLGAIARRYNVSVSSLIASNPGVRATNLQVGRNLAIPSGGTAVATVATSLPPAPVSSGTGFAWPVAGNITSGFGWRWGRMHNGVDIPGPYGSPIVAVQGGTVIFAGWHAGGYGNMVKIQHPNGLVTLYAHGNQIHVAQGQTVRQGQLIMGRGSTGWSTGPHLHFEVHVNGAPVNPYGYLN